jgi:hypothetical protein
MTANSTNSKISSAHCQRFMENTHIPVLWERLFDPTPSVKLSSGGGRMLPLSWESRPWRGIRVSPR